MIPPSGAKKSWASIFAKPEVPKVVEKVLPAPIVDKLNDALGKDTHKEKEEEKPAAKEEEPAPAPTSTEESLPPPKHELTEDNLEKLPDESHPVSTETQASIAADSGLGTPSAAGSGLGLSTATSRMPSSGYAATAGRAAAGGRAPSYNRKVWDQQEAVVMPGNHAVDRAAVQFGSLGLNGSGEDIDSTLR